MRYQIYADNTTNFLGINSMGYSDDPLITRFGPGFRNQYIIHYVTRGSGYYNGTLVREGQGFLISPNQKECYYPTEEDPWAFLWIIATGELMDGIFEKYDIDPKTKVFAYGNLSDLNHTADYIVQNHNRIMESTRILERFLHILNGHAARTYSHPEKSNAEVYVDFCVDYIERNIHQKITIRELTALLGVTQPYLYKIFQDRFRMSVKQYITQSKHQYAKILLTKTDLTVTEVATSIGYDDALAFSKAFKLQVGVSPSEYKKNRSL